MKNKIITSEGNIQFVFGDSGKVINIHPFHIFTSFNEDTISFIQIALPKSSGLALMTSTAEDLEVNGSSYSFEQLKDVLAEEFAEAGAQARAEVVTQLPVTGKTNTIYLVPKAEGSGYDEYIYIKDESKWELLGDTDIELSRYIKKSDFNTYSAETKTVIDSKQDKLIAGENITISGNVISAQGGGGITSGEVETMIEDYMTTEIPETLFDTKFIYANDASLWTYSGRRRFEVRFDDEFDKKAKIIPYNNYELPDKICVNHYTTFFIINSAYVNAIPSILKDSTPRWIKINQLIDKPTKATDLIPSWRHDGGAIESNYVAWSEVSGDTYYCLAENAGVWDFAYTSDYDFDFNSYGFSDQYAIVLSGKESDKGVNINLLGEYIFYYSKNNQETFEQEGYFSPIVMNFSGTTTGTYDSNNKYIDGKVNNMVDKTYVAEDFIYTKGRGININNNTISIDLPLSRGNGFESLKENGASEANGDMSHAEGNGTHANGDMSHAEGFATTANGDMSHAEGYTTYAKGDTSHAEGGGTFANGENSHAEGLGTITNNTAEHASGFFNLSSSASTTLGNSGNTLFSVGNGGAANKLHNAFEIRQNGDIYISNTNASGEYYAKPMIKLQDIISQLEARIQALENGN